MPPHMPPDGPPHLPPAPRKQSSSTAGWVILALFMGVGMGGACSTCLHGAAGVQDEVIVGGGDRVGVVELLGVITDSTEVVRHIRQFAKRDDLVAIVVRIDSPGGSVAPSQEIYSALRAAAKEKPIVASMGSVAASGGLWSALAADWIFASPGSVTGSIGVITELPDLRGIAELLRFKMRVFKSGPLKDAGNPLREMTPADEELFRSLINDIYEQFVSVVAERRNMDRERVLAIADGRVMTGRAAIEAGLVDELGDLHVAAKKAVVLAKARKEEEEGKTVTSTAVTDDVEDPTLVYPKKPLPGLFRMLTEGAERAIAEGIAGGIERSTERAGRSLSTTPMELR